MWSEDYTVPKVSSEGLSWRCEGLICGLCPSLAAMSHFIGFNKAERANNCHLSREAKPPHVLQIGE